MGWGGCGGLCIVSFWWRYCSVSGSSLLLELKIIAVKWHRECELCAPQLRTTAIRCRVQTAECGTMWGRPPMSVPPPFSPKCSWKRHRAGAWELSDSHQPWRWFLKCGYFWFSKRGWSHSTFSAHTGCFFSFLICNAAPSFYLFEECPLRGSGIQLKALNPDVSHVWYSLNFCQSRDKDQHLRRRFIPNRICKQNLHIWNLW